MTARSITKSLGGHRHGSYGSARCSAHEDQNPSLSITERNGKLLVHCFAGCSQQAVLKALRDRRLLPNLNTEMRHTKVGRKRLLDCLDASLGTSAFRSDSRWGGWLPLPASRCQSVVSITGPRARGAIRHES